MGIGLAKTMLGIWVMFYGLPSDRGAARRIAKASHVNYLFTVDRRARSLWRQQHGAFYQSLWGLRTQNWQRRLGLQPWGTVVFARETLDNTWDGDCVIGGVVLCESGKGKECVKALRKTVCRKY